MIAKAGRPLVKVMPIDAPEPGAERRLGVLSRPAILPDDFDRIGTSEIEALFGRDD